MTFQEIFVFKKMEEINGYLKETEELLRFSDQEILADSGRLHIAERLLQLIVDAMVDINQHFIRELNLTLAEDFQSTFYALGENNILPADFTQRIAPVVGLRNRIVHRYEELDKALFITLFRKNYTDFKFYLKYINNYLKTKK